MRVAAPDAVAGASKIISEPTNPASSVPSGIAPVPLTAVTDEPQSCGVPEVSVAMLLPAVSVTPSV